ncbi:MULTISPECIES: prepilin-type N-terminal cleavage/methylation domain-containing protein [unclassified Deinococcus]|uniref:prepilin-type N-terminal cleavage/methylation domain-containing protein n=1 Tax=unclassified Deinococcus TaxID=2623546 RepID=UPI001C2FC24F|nr:MULTISPECIES: prepilin-type N-terminal cleavage/methylation domain-containing protein [unclassified Deinococcus]MDK2014553.1 type II secretion system protein [Deinococcus sp. 43]
MRPDPRVLHDRHAQLTQDLTRVAEELDHLARIALTHPTPDVHVHLQRRHADLHTQLQDITRETQRVTHLQSQSQEPPTNQHAQGFTLIELLVVIAIIGVLAAILLPTFSDAQKRPYNVAAQQCGRAIVAAQIPYRAGTGSYTSDPAQLGPDVKEACRDAGVQVGVHATSPTAATAAYLMSGANDVSFAFTAFHPRGTGFYRYWLTSPSPVASGDRLNTLFPY